MHFFLLKIFVTACKQLTSDLIVTRKVVGSDHHFMTGQKTTKWCIIHMLHISATFLYNLVFYLTLFLALYNLQIAEIPPNLHNS